MSTIIKKVEELFRFKMPDKAAMAEMTEMERQELKASFMAAIPSKMEVDQLQPKERQAVIDTVMQTAAAMPGSMMEEPMPTAGGPALVAQGQFKGGEGDNQGTGRALIYQFSRSEHLLRFEDFAVSNGPALHVILCTMFNVVIATATL